MVADTSTTSFRISRNPYRTPGDGRGQQGTAGRRVATLKWGDPGEIAQNVLRYLVGDPYPCWCQWLQIRFRVYVRYDAVYQYYSITFNTQVFSQLTSGGHIAHVSQLQFINDSNPIVGHRRRSYMELLELVISDGTFNMPPGPPRSVA